jgi:hypothetical protein
MAEYQDKNGKEVKAGTRVLLPCRVIKLEGMNSPLIQLETEEAYGHENARVTGPLKGRTKTALWAEPGQIEVAE